jgi:hypothetical protein
MREARADYDRTCSLDPSLGLLSSASREGPRGPFAFREAGAVLACLLVMQPASGCGATAPGRPLPIRLAKKLPRGAADHGRSPENELAAEVVLQLVSVDEARTRV